MTNCTTSTIIGDGNSNCTTNKRRSSLNKILPSILFDMSDSSFNNDDDLPQESSSSASSSASSTSSRSLSILSKALSILGGDDDDNNDYYYSPSMTITSEIRNTVLPPCSNTEASST